MVEEDLGTATIVYEDPDGETVEQTVENEHIAYFQDHWVLKTGEDESGRDTVRRIPHHRVYHVERSVEEFQEEITTIRSQLRSMAEEFQQKIVGGESSERSQREAHQIEITSDGSRSDDQ